MKLWQTLAVCAAAVVVTWTASRSCSERLEPSGEHAAAVSRSPRGDLSADALTDLRAQVAALRVTQETLRAEVSALDPDTATHLPAGDPEADSVLQESRPELATIVEEQQAALEKLLSQEQDDPEWATWAAGEIRTQAATVLSNASAVHTECRATLCRTEVTFADPEETRQALDRLSGLVTWNSDCFALIDDSQPTSAVLYATREGAAMPRVTAAGI